MTFFSKAATLLIAGFASASINAAVVNMSFSTDGTTDSFSLDNVDRGGSPDAVVNCPAGACTFLGAVDSSTLPNSNPDTELAYLNTLIATDLASDTDLTKNDDPESDFSISGEYFWMKFGNAIHAFFRNAWFPGTTEVSVTTGKAAGLSHYVQTPPSEVPLPGTLGLLGLGLAGLGLLRRTRSDASAA